MRMARLPVWRQGRAQGPLACYARTLHASWPNTASAARGEAGGAVTGPQVAAGPDTAWRLRRGLCCERFLRISSHTPWAVHTGCPSGVARDGHAPDSLMTWKYWLHPERVSRQTASIRTAAGAHRAEDGAEVDPRTLNHLLELLFAQILAVVHSQCTRLHGRGLCCHWA